MQNLRYDGLMVLRDNLQCSSERLWASLLLSAIQHTKKSVQVFLLTASGNTLKKRYPALIQCTSMKEIDSLTDVLGEAPEVAKSSEETLIFLDSVDVAFLSDPFDRVVAMLKKISVHGAVIARIHEECLSGENWERLLSVTQWACSLKLDEMKKPVCKTISYKKNGKRNIKIETVHVDDSLSLFVKPYTSPQINENKSLLTPESSFDMGLNLKKSELEAKRQVVLPFEAAQKETELVGLHVTGNRKIRAGGRIIYTPDEADDFDESDPDDDLEI